MKKEKKDIQKSKGGVLRVFEFITEVIGWLQIVASPLLIGLVIGSIIYFTDPSKTRLIIGITVAIVGLILGIIWGTKEWNGKGTIWFMSRIMATPELDKKMKKLILRKIKSPSEITYCGLGIICSDYKEFSCNYSAKISLRVWVTSVSF